MLHIRELTIKNYRPYYGLKTFRFGDNKGLSIILGDNGIGKSSLIRAIKFVLYGEIEGDRSFKIKNELNILAWEERNFDLFVELKFFYNKDEYNLIRSIRIKRGIHELPKSDNDFEISSSLIKNGSNLTPSDADAILKNIIPKQISEYILFEGETISKYKTLLDKNKNLEIYESIRKILGIKTLENSKHDLEFQLEKYNSELKKFARAKSNNEKFNSQIEENSEKIKRFNIELENYKNKYEEIKEDIKNYEEILNNNNRIRELMKKENEIVADLKVVETLIENDKEEIKDLLKNYKDICYDVIKQEASYMPSELQILKEIQNRNNNYKENIKSLKDIVNATVCKHCGSNIDENNKRKLVNDINEYETKIQKISKKGLEKLEVHEKREKELTSLLLNIENENILDQIIDKEIKIQSNLIDLRAIKERLKENQDQIKQLGGSTEELTKVLNNHVNAKLNEKLFLDNIEKLEEEIAKLNARNESIIKKISKEVDMTSRTKKIKKTNLLIDLFDKAIDIYSIQMRNRVQNDATEMFRSISENKEYDRLEFDEYYGLKLIDKKNRVVPNVSSGYMNLITLSLIYGLHKNSTLTGTIILDAPFSVLTHFHRDKIVEAFQSLSPQVILLVYKDQIDLNSIRKKMKEKLINEFEIYQDRKEDNSSYKTNVRSVVNYV